MEKETEFRDLGDPYLISYLLAVEFKPIKRLVVRNTLLLRFIEDEELENAISNFYGGKGTVDALHLLNTWRTVNQMIRDVARSVEVR